MKKEPFTPYEIPCICGCGQKVAITRRRDIGRQTVDRKHAARARKKIYVKPTKYSRKQTKVGFKPRKNFEFAELP